MNAIWARIQDEPVATQGVVQSILTVFVAFGLGWSGDEVAAVVICSAAILSWLTRKAVTPVSAVTIAAAPAKP